MRLLFVIERPKNKALFLTQLQPLGVLYIASYLESKGIQTEVLDLNVESRGIDASGYDFVGFSVNSANIENTMSSIKEVSVQNPKCKIILGGPLVRLMPEKLLHIDGVHCLIDGEAEMTTYEILSGHDLAGIRGIWFKKGDKSFFTGKREGMVDLDSLPFPALEKVPYRRYRVVLKKRSPVASIITSRGCPYDCVFCDHSLGFKYRARSPQNVIAEMKRDISLGIKELWIADDNFTMDMKRVDKLLDMMIKEKLDITFSMANGVRADRLDARTLSKLKKAGCWMLSISPETGNSESLKKINKGFSLDHAIRAARLCKKFGITVMSNYVVGFPWETEKEIEKTIAFARKLDADINHFSRILPFPGTPLWSMVDRKDFGVKDDGENFGGLRYEHPSVDDATFRRLIKKAYRDTMLDPKKILHLARTLNIRDFITFGLYSVRTGNL
jgi:anaerobic magnesium-protoporphyrin IX monomethyl ester cyclase